ncbi:MAG: TIGR01777 family oxidoreductase [Bacteriovoracia bacterium]
MKILLTGATGFVGRPLCEYLKARGHDLVVLTRSGKAAIGRAVRWDYTRGPVPAEALRDVDAVIHLAGESVASRWTDKQKKLIRDSRVLTTQSLLDSLKRSHEHRCKVFVSASAIGIYGNRADQMLTEISPPGNGFLADVCKEWESTLFADAETGGMRKVALRFGMVLGEGGGALPKMLPIFRAGLGGPLGSGRQYMSWIHIADLVHLVDSCLTSSEFQGPINAVAPNPVTNREFSRVLGKVLRRPTFLKAPAFAIKAALGEMSEVLLDSQRVFPERAIKAGFSCTFERIEDALVDILSEPV